MATSLSLYDFFKCTYVNTTHMYMSPTRHDTRSQFADLHLTLLIRSSIQSVTGPAHEGMNSCSAQEGINSKGNIIDICMCIYMNIMSNMYICNNNTLTCICMCIPYWLARREICIQNEHVVTFCMRFASIVGSSGGFL